MGKLCSCHSRGFSRFHAHFTARTRQRWCGRCSADRPVHLNWYLHHQRRLFRSRRRTPGGGSGPVRRGRRASTGLAAEDDAETDPVTIVTTELGGRPLEPEAPESAAAMDSEAVYTSGDLERAAAHHCAPGDSAATVGQRAARERGIFQSAGRPPGACGTGAARIVACPLSRADDLSHIKAWTFRPAMKDGRPVRYRLRIRLAV